MTAALYYHPEAYSISGPKLMGRNAAGESFLRGFLAYSRKQEILAYSDSPEHHRILVDAVAKQGRHKRVRVVDRNSMAGLKDSTLYFPGPDIGQLAWQRTSFGNACWSICGITHTTCSARVMDGIAELLTAPVQPWDAIITSSTEVKKNVERIMQSQADYLKARLGIQRLVLPKLPVIPLGIHTDDFAFTAEQRASARKAIGADEQTIIVLYVGRLSFHAKAHPLAMYQALQRVARTCPNKKLVLVECGWHGTEYVADAYHAAARLACPDVRHIDLDGRKAEGRQTAWASADIFCSLSDNIQETFGITPIEAMAAGLPVVVSDWDGYKDTVRDGVDGYRIPTLMPAAGMGGDLALRHALNIDSYDLYCGNTSSLVAVDIDATAEALTRLVASPELRERLGANGRARAIAEYDWKVIIPQYEALWDELDAIRSVQSQPEKKLPVPWPARMDPFSGFATYPSRTLSAETCFELAAQDAASVLRNISELRQLVMVSYASLVIPEMQELTTVLEVLADGPATAGAMMQTIPAERRPFVFRGLAWLLKIGAIRQRKLRGNEVEGEPSPQYQTDGAQKKSPGNPSQQELNELALFVREGRNHEAERKAQDLIESHPEYGVAWKVLGIVLHRQGRFEQALRAKRSAVELLPADPEAHNNYGFTLQEVGMYAEAEISLRHALQLNPQYAEAYNNLGLTLQQLGQLEQAEDSFKQALALKPKYIEAINNLGKILARRGDAVAAEHCYRQALQFNSEHVETFNCLGDLYLNLDRHEEATVCYKRSIVLAPNSEVGYNNLGAAYYDSDDLERALELFSKAIEIRPRSSLILHNLGRTYYQKGDLPSATECFRRALDISSKDWIVDSAGYLAVLHYLMNHPEATRRLIDEFKGAVFVQDANLEAYFNYLNLLIEWDAADVASTLADDGTIYVFGESHALTLHNKQVMYRGKPKRCQSIWIIGCKQWHLANAQRNKQKLKFEREAGNLPCGSTILLTIGEIDCRPNEGIVQVKKKRPNLMLEKIVEETVAGYLDYVAKVASLHNHRLIICGIPATNIPLSMMDMELTTYLIDTIRLINENLKEKTRAAGMEFLDVYMLTDQGTGTANGTRHLDRFHLLPSAMIEAFERLGVS